MFSSGKNRTGDTQLLHYMVALDRTFFFCWNSFGKYFFAVHPLILKLHVGKPTGVGFSTLEQEALSIFFLLCMHKFSYSRQ